MILYLSHKKNKYFFLNLKLNKPKSNHDSHQPRLQTYNNIFCPSKHPSLLGKRKKEQGVCTLKENTISKSKLFET